MPRTVYKPGSQHPQWKGGKCLNEKGYVKMSNREQRHKYEHRVVIEEALKKPLCADYVFPGGVLPPNMVVHHQDHNRTHNCHGNLMVLPHYIHNALSRAYKQYIQEHYEEFVEFMQQKFAAEDEVPF